MKYVIVEFKGPETDWVVGLSLADAVEHARDEIDDMAEAIDSGEVVPRELSVDEVNALQIRIEDGDYTKGTEDKYSTATEHIDGEIQAGRCMPFHFMATYF